jgi:hypothetical protein
MRYLAPQLATDLQKKMVLLAGPGQCGKTHPVDVAGLESLAFG